MTQRITFQTLATPRALLLAALAATAACGDSGTTSGTGGGSSTSTTTSGTGGSECGAGTVLCGDACTVTAFDPQNCGTCGTVCGTGEFCSQGMCGSECTGGTTQCGNLCVDTQNDPANCGTCDNACGTDEFCSLGQCGSECVGGTTQCGSLCAQTDYDPNNCGACDNVCAVGEVCSQGNCGVVCSGGTTQCGTACIDTTNDPNNCGVCDNVCAPGELCSQGLCGLECSGGTTECNTLCVDTETDPANCGDCDVVCGAGELCSGGMCTSVCGGNLTKCGNSCLNTMTDSNNCGMCNNACAPGATCVAGMCQQCNSATTDCDGDGWLASQGDCCDKPGACGAEPAKVNPGAIEVVGNGIDDNCNNLSDLFDTADTIACDSALTSNSQVAGDYAKALGICRTTTLNPALPSKTWGLISAQLQRADGSALSASSPQISIRSSFGTSIQPIHGSKLMVVSSGIAADGSQTAPGPNGGAPSGFNVSNTQSSTVSIATGGLATSIKDWFAAANPPLKAANQLPAAPMCGTASGDSDAEDSVMLVLTLRAPTNAKAFSFNTYFMSAEYPEFVCTSFNDQLVALVDTPNGTPSPIANPIDKNLLTYSSMGQKWPIGINIAKGTNLFSVCETQAQNGACWDADVSATSCQLGMGTLGGTGFEKTGGTGCTIGGGTYWLTTSGNVIPGDTVQVRIALWDVGDQSYDSLALLDGFQWLADATLPGTN